MHTELASQGLDVITVAFDQSFDAARPWIEAAAPTHPALVDTEHVVADLYNMVNVPTVVWIDEEGKVVRPNDVHFLSEDYTAIHGMRAAKPMAALRAWVAGERSALTEGTVEALRQLPTDDDQLARAEFALAWWLSGQGREDAAERHFVRAGELAPHDFTIRRGSMPIRGLDPGGPDFFAMVTQWVGAGHQYYVPLPDTATTR